MGKQPTKQLEQDKQKLNQTQSNVSWTKKNVKDRLELHLRNQAIIQGQRSQLISGAACLLLLRNIS